SVAANSFPKEFSILISAALEGNFSLARAMNDRLLEAYEILFAENNPAGVKAFLNELGIIENHLRLPLVPLSKSLEDRVKNYLVRFNETAHV
ncbi:MAG TPA: dihydrodipicolinate synthase family protein, partial [Chitinophagaceae bacterium]